jgi:hypothetical protein
MAATDHWISERAPNRKGQQDCCWSKRKVVKARSLTRVAWPIAVKCIGHMQTWDSETLGVWNAAASVILVFTKNDAAHWVCVRCTLLKRSKHSFSAMLHWHADAPPFDLVKWERPDLVKLARFILGRHTRHFFLHSHTSFQFFTQT